MLRAHARLRMSTPTNGIPPPALICSAAAQLDDADGGTAPIQIAAALGHAAALRRLAAHGARIEISTDGILGVTWGVLREYHWCTRRAPSKYHY